MFNPEAPLMVFLARLADLFVINLLFLLCCIPIVTIGASITAMYRTVFALGDGEGGLARTFFRSFRENFGQATVVWLILAVVFAMVGVDVWLLYQWDMFNSFPVLLMTILVGVVLGMVSSYAFPFLSRFKTGTLRLFTSAFALGTKNIITTVAILVVNLLPFFMFFFATATFLVFCFVWLTVGFSVSAYSNALLLRKVFKAYLPEEPKEEAEENGQE